MASINDYISKSTPELVEEFLTILNELNQEHNTSTSKTRDNLLNCIESNKKNNLNSKKRCDDTLLELDNQQKSLSPKYAVENEKILEKNEARIAANNKSIDEYKKIYKDEIVEINKKYDLVVNEENDRLENLQHLNRKELQHYLQQIDAEEITQRKELESTIEELTKKIRKTQESLIINIEDLKHDYLIKSSGFNEDMRRTRNEFINKEKELRAISREETSTHHKQIEELTKEISIKQKNILNTFSTDFMDLSNLDDKILLDNANDQIKLLTLQAENKEKKRILEIQKDNDLLLEKEKDNTKIRNLKIIKQDIDNQNTTRINRENVYSLMRISEFEKDSLLSDAIKENKISGISLDSNAKINRLHEKLNDKKNDLDFFLKRFDLLRNSKKRTIELYSHLYDVTTTLVLDLNQLEREYVLEQQKAILDKKIEDVNYLNKVSEYECNKELAINNLKLELESIEYEMQKINISFDHSVFKTRSSYNTEKTRIEHIYQMFDSKYNTELKALETDITFIYAIIAKLKEEIIRTVSTTIDDLRKEKESNDKINAFYKMMTSDFNFMKEQVENYYSNKDLRFTPDVDEIINDYIKASIDKKRAFESEFKELTNKTQAIETEIKEIENDIFMLEANRKQYVEKSKKTYDEKFELREFDEQIEEKSFRLHILRLRLKSQAKEMSNLETEMLRIDEGKDVFAKKENKRLYELDFDNTYYNKYEDLQEIILSMFNQLLELAESSLEKADLKSLYSFNSNAIKYLNKATSSIKSFHFDTINEYKNEFKKIAKVCSNNIEKEKKTFEINLDMINRERDIAIDDEQSKIVIAKKNSRDLEVKYNIDIINIKQQSDATQAKIDNELNDYNIKYGLNVAALESNASSMKSYYDDAIARETKQRVAKLANLYKERKINKLSYEDNLAKLRSNYDIEKEKHISMAKNRINNVLKQYTQKCIEYDTQLKGLDDALKKSSAECNSAIIDSDVQLSDFIKKLENNKNYDIKKVKAETNKKLKHDIKRYRIELENKNEANV